MGACMLVRRAAIDEVGPPDPSFFLFSEEVDWCYRFAQAGWKTLFTPDGAVHARRRRLARRPALPRQPARATCGSSSSITGSHEAERVRVAAAHRARPPRQDRPRREGGDVPRRRPLARDGRRALADRAMSSVFLLVRLALATGLVLAPGAIVARAVGVRSTSATLAWGLGIVFARDDRRLRGARLADAGARAARSSPRSSRRRSRSAGRPVPRDPGRGVRLGRRVPCSGCCSGTSPARSAVTASSTSPASASSSSSATSRSSSVNEFADGGLHPGYAFPLWQAFLALVAKVAFVDPAKVVLHEPTRARAARRARRLRGGLRGCSGGSCPPPPRPEPRSAIAAMAPGHGGAYTSLALPATASRQLLVPAALALAFAAMRAPDERAARERRRRVARARRRPPDLRDLPLDPVRRLPRRALGVAAREGRQRRARPRRARRARPGCSSSGSCPSSASTASVSPDAHERARALRALRRPAATARPTSSGSRRRCSAARARSPSPRCS